MMPASSPPSPKGETEGKEETHSFPEDGLLDSAGPTRSPRKSTFPPFSPHCTDKPRPSGKNEITTERGTEPSADSAGTQARVPGYLKPDPSIFFYLVT